MEPRFNKTHQTFNPTGQDTGKPSQQTKLRPSQLLSKQRSGNVVEDLNQRPKIVQFLNIADFSTYTDSAVPIDEPLFAPIPAVIQFTDYEPLQVQDKIFSLRNKDKYPRRVKIIPPDLKLFQVLPYSKTKKAVIEDDTQKIYAGSQVAPGMEISFLIRFSPEAKIDYTFDLIIVTEREKFITPIIATGKKAMIDFPDVLDFSHCPVKYCTEKAIVIRNIGEKTTRWFMKLPAPFDADKKEGVLENGKHEQIVIKFTPTESKEYSLEGVFSYDHLKAYVVCTGKAHDGQVYLSKSHIQMDDAYIGLQTQQTLQIVNKSNVKVDFQWRAFQTEKEESEKKSKLLAQLEQEEAEEKMLVREINQNDLNYEDYGLDDEEDSDREVRDEPAIMMERQRANERAIIRKYRNIRKAIEDDQLLFQDEIFRIEPLSGQIWPNSALTVTVTFEPLAALNYSCTAFCNISCKEERLPLNLAGEGIGPKAVITPQDDIDLGDITITAIKTKDFTIENRGEIPAAFHLLLPDTPAARMFKFDVDKGVLGVGERLNFTVTFQSEMLGEFSETFRFRLEGSTELIPLRFRGHVIGPSFKFDKKEIDFGNVSYSFPEKKQITLMNTSPVSFRFSLWIPGDGPYEHREFEIHPQRDVINKGESRVIDITFTPNTVKRYELTLKIDILGVGEGLYSIPIHGESFVPTVKVRPHDTLDFGEEVFLRHPTTSFVELINESDLPAKFEIAPQSKESKVLAVFTTDRERGTIERQSVLRLNITLETFKLGEINLPLAIHVVGNNGLPHVVNIIATSRGPIVEVTEKELDFGSVEVLKDWTKTIRVHNKSLIKADFSVFTKNKQSIFKPLQKHGILEPNKVMDIQVVCTPDDNVKFTDTLHFVIKEGFDIDVPLKAKGVGPTVFCKEDLRLVSFGLQYTFKYDHREIFIENKGRRSQKLQWQAKKKPEPKKPAIKDEKKQGKDGQNPEEEPVSTFTIMPDTVVLPPKTGLMFQFRAYSTKKGKISEEFELLATAGNDRKANTLYYTVLEGDFIEPTLAFSESKLYFKYSWEKNVPFMPITKNLELTCSSQLPTNFMIKVPSPFSVSSEVFSLLPGRSVTVKVSFDPGLKLDKISGQTINKLQIVHIDHPHREYVNLVGEVCFPNLKLDTNAINFGSIMHETSKKLSMNMQNVSEMILNYEWHFMDEEIIRDRPRASLENNTSNISNLERREADAVSINEIFDILPLKGFLRPGETEKVEFIFNALLSQKVKTVAVCSVDGGPDYEMRLGGDASAMTYRLSHKFLDFGVMNFNDWEAREIILENTGKVTYEFKVNLSSVVRESLVEVIPQSGSVKGFEKQKIVVRMCPGLPDLIEEHFFIEISHFEPERIDLRASAIYPSLSLSLQRKENPDFIKHLEPERNQINLSKVSEKIPSLKPLDETVIMSDAELEAERKMFCDYILKNLNEVQVAPPPMSRLASAIPTSRDRMLSMSKDEIHPTEDSKMHSFVKTGFKTAVVKQLNPKVYDKIVLGTFFLDLENIVLGSSKKKTFKITNPCNNPVSFTFDQKVYKLLNMTINPDRVMRLGPGESTIITLTYQTKKNNKCGKTKMIVPIDVKFGPRYNLTVMANITIPEISVQSDIVDFQKVLVGQKKTVFVRFENNREVTCDWNLSTRADLMSATDKEGNRFAMYPTSGVIKPGKKQMIEFTFIPLSERPYANKFTIIVKDNPKVLVIQVKATGVTVSLEFNPEVLSVGPVLPYDNKAVARLDVINPSEYDTELFSLNFDPTYLHEEEMLKAYDPFDTSETLYFPVRAPNQPFWDKIKKAHEIKLKRSEFAAKMKELTSQAQIDQTAVDKLQAETDQYNAENEEKPVIVYPPKVKDHLKHHLIIFGPPGCGKTQLAQFLSKTHQRHIVNMNEILAWNIEHETEEGLKAKAYLDQRRAEYEQIMLERSKKKKKKGEEDPDPRKEDYEYLTEELLIGLLQKRIDTPYCNAGIIFDNLTSTLYPKEIDALRVIMKVIPDQHLQLVNLYYPVDSQGLGVSEIITPPGLPGVFDSEPVVKEPTSRPTSRVVGLRPGTKEEVRTREKKPTQIRIRSAVTRGGNKENKTEKEMLIKQTEKAEKTDAIKTEDQAEEIVIEKGPLFEVNYPLEISPEELQAYYQKGQDLLDVLLGQYKEPLPPVKEEKKEDPKKDPKALAKGTTINPKDLRKGGKTMVPEPPVVVEEEKKVEPEEPKIEVPKQTLVSKDNKSIIRLPVVFNYQQFNKSILEHVPEPQFPDMDKEPVPEPIFHQILRRSEPRARLEKMKYFTILTPKGNYVNETSEDLIPLNESLEDNTIADQARWIIPAKQKITLYLKFFSKTPGNYEANIDFESYFSMKGYKVPCLGICDFPNINSNPVNVFMQRKKTRPANPPESYISKYFITQENVFDFGPLLIGKDPTKKSTNSYIYVNSSVFRLTNNGKFDAEIELSLASSVLEGPAPKGSAPDGAMIKKGIFIFEQEKLSLKVDQTEDLRVWAFPETPITYRDQLICMIKDNPVPITFDLQCTGVKPTVQVDNDNVQFQRILLNQSVTEYVKVKNVCAVPIKWKLSGLQDLPEEFTIQNTSGTLKPTQEAVVEITFRGIKQQKFQNKIIVEAEDNENIGLKQPPLEVKINAEAFMINVTFDPNNPENMLNFGDVRVEDTKEQKFPIKNVGLYDISYRFVMKKKLFRENFKIEPAEGVIAPNQEKIVTFKFCSQQELKLKTTSNTTDIVLEILEGKSLEIFNKIMINVTVNSVFSKYSLIPSKTINFGPVQFDEPRTRQFDIKNEGIFEFNYTIFDYNDEARRKEIFDEELAARQAAEEAAAALAAGIKPKPGDKAKADAAKKKTEPPKGKKDPKKIELPGLTIGPWNIDPPTGTIAPDSSQTIKVTFRGIGQKLFEQKLGIHISRRDAKDQPKGIIYEVVGESCVPAINTENFESLFEEQIVVPSMSNSQALQERVNSNVFSIEEKTFYFGTVVHSKQPKGIQEQFKISNPGKIPCTVKFDVKKRSSSANEQFAFKVSPASVSINPHQHKYVTVSFEPEIIASYGGLFEAIVEKGEQIPKTGRLLFDLRGDCALPTLKIDRPRDWADDRTPLLKFPKTRLDKSYILPIVLKNDGQIPATAEFELKPHDSFRFLDQSMFTISAKTSSTFNVEFRPKDPGPKQWEIIVKTRDNPYENPRLMIRGEGFQEDIIFDGLPKDLEDEINFGDCIIGIEKKLMFRIKNNSNTSVKFRWDTTTEDLVMSPRIGHIHPNAAKWITCIFKSAKTVIYKELPMVCQVQGITVKDTKDWDDAMFTTRFVTKTEYDWSMKKQEEERKRREEEELSKKKGAKKEVKKAPKGGKDVEKEEKMPPIDPNEEANMSLSEPIPEPENQLIEKTEKNLVLKANAVADYVRYDCEPREITFAPTLMFTSRVYSFSLRNTSHIQMKYICKIVSAETGVYDSGYFSVTPKAGQINPDCEDTITVKFSPKEVEESNARLLVISFENLDPTMEKLIIELDGEAERPVCHFELPPPVLRDRKAQDLAQEGKYHVIEFESLGTKIKNIKRFYVINPTNQGYEFEWAKEMEEQGKNTYSSFFKCLTPKGTILSGKKFEMVFEYLPDIAGNHESYWGFKIPSEKITHHFAFLGNVAEPNVFLEVGSINFGPLLLGGKNKEVIKLKNLEHIPFAFSFDKDAVKGDADYGESLIVHPMSGVVSADGEIPIEVTFQPKYEKNYNYNLVLNVKQKTRSINLNIKGHGYTLHHSVNIDSSAPISNSIDQILDFGDIYINEKRSKTITINNSGDFNFDFAIKKSQFSFITISPENATVLKNEKVNIEVIFWPITEYRLKSKSHYFTLNIVSGPTYCFRFAGSARKPAVEFSFLEYDFGPSYVLKQPLPRTAVLEIFNTDTSAMSVETLFEKTHYLDVQLAPGQVVLPSTKARENVLKVPIVFTPRELKRYEEDVEFDINGLHKIAVKVRAEGVPLKVELEKAEDSNIDFGVVGVGADITRVARLINYGKRAVTLTMNFNEQLENISQKSGLLIYPDKEFTLNPKEGADIEIRFNPKTRLHQFKHELFYQIIENKEVYKLCNITGSCHGIELKLHQETVGFGSVVVNSKLTREVVVENLGDVNAKFAWDTTYCSRYFTITPQQGVIPAHEDFVFSITFHPDVIDNDISFNKVRCEIEGSNPLFINLLGKGIPQTKESIQEVKFKAIVRTTDKQKVIIKNPTDTPWKIKSAITSVNPAKNYFSGKEFLEVPKNGQAEYEIFYQPLTMTKNEKELQIIDEYHEGTLFFPTPDGSALLFNLVGVSLPPNETEVFNLTIKAKKTETHVIPVRNWLKTTQRFAVRWEVENNDPNILLKGANTIDIPGEAIKDYKLTIYGLKAMNGKAVVTYKNEQTGEYIFYRLNLNVTPPDAIETFDLISTVREPTQKLLTIENPLNKPVQIMPEQLVCDSDTITFNPPSFTIQPQSEFGLEVNFRPLVVGEKKCNLVIKSPDLGEFPYQIRLVGMPPTAQKSMSFKTPLGTDLVQKFKFTNYVKKPLPYAIRVERQGPGAKAVPAKEKGGKDKPPIPADFVPEVQTITVPAATSYEGTDQEIGIRFDPSNLGESRGVLIISSPEGGEYQCLLIGNASPPVPKGPIKIGTKSVTVEFKNPFFEPAQFTIRLDNPSFTTSAKTITSADAKKNINIPITYKPVAGYLPTGRLIIQTGDMPAWIYYLQGE